MDRCARACTLLLVALVGVETPSARAHPAPDSVAQRQWTGLDPVHLLLYRRDFVRLFAGAPGQHVMLAVDYARDDLWLYTPPTRHSRTYTQSAVNPARGTELFRIGPHTLRLPVRYGSPLDGSEAFDTGVVHDGLLGLGAASALWRYWNCSSSSAYSLTLGADDVFTSDGGVRRGARDAGDAGQLLTGAHRYVLDACTVANASYRVVLARENPYTYLPPQLLHLQSLEICPTGASARRVQPAGGSGSMARAAGTASPRRGLSRECFKLDLGDATRVVTADFREPVVRRHPTSDTEIVLGRVPMRRFATYACEVRGTRLVGLAHRTPDECSDGGSLWLCAITLGTWILWTIGTAVPAPPKPAPPKPTAATVATAPAAAATAAKTRSEAGTDEAWVADSAREGSTQRGVPLLLLEGYSALLALVILTTFTYGTSGRKVVRNLTRSDSEHLPNLLWAGTILTQVLELVLLAQELLAVYATASTRTAPHVFSVCEVRRALVSTVLMLAVWMCMAEVQSSWDDRVYLVIAATLLVASDSYYTLRMVYRSDVRALLLAPLTLAGYAFAYFFALRTLDPDPSPLVPPPLFQALLYYATLLIFPASYIAARTVAARARLRLRVYPLDEVLLRYGTRPVDLSDISGADDAHDIDSDSDPHSDSGIHLVDF